MALELTFLGHSGFVLSDGTSRLAVDPWLSGNPVAEIAAEDVHCTHLALTHGHADHMSDAAAIAARTGATVIAAFEICEHLGAGGLDKLESANPGGKIVTDFGWVALTQAFHSSSFEGKYMGMPCGLMIHMAGKTVYHMGDTTIFGDMKLLGEIYRPEVALVPIGDRFTMGPELATRATELVAPRFAVPIHFNTFPALAQDPADFAPAGVEVKVMSPGETWALDD